MSSKISGADGNSAAPVGVSRASSRPQDTVSGTGTPGTAEGSSGSGSQNVQITGAALQRASLEQAVRDLPAVNETRVAQVRSAIEQGTYTVRPEHIADQLMRVEHILSQIPDKTDGEPASTGQ